MTNNIKRLRSIKPNPADCLDQISAAYSRLSTSEKKLADFILMNSHLLRDYSSLQLAKAAEISQSSVVKFSQNLGYSGFTDLKLAINESVLRKQAERKHLEQQYSPDVDAASAVQSHNQQASDAPSKAELSNTSNHSHQAIQEPKHNMSETAAVSDLSKLETSLDQLSTNERKLASFLLQNSALIRDYSSQQVASSTGVSQSSVVKFSQKMGYKGFTDLKMAIHESVVRQSLDEPAPIKKAGASDDNFDNLLEAKNDAMQLTVKLNGSEQLEQAAALLESSASVQIYSQSSSFLAGSLSRGLMSIGQPVIMVETAAEVIKLIGTGRTDLLVVIYEHQNMDLAQLSKQIRKADVPTILITDHQYRAGLTQLDAILYFNSDGNNEFHQASNKASQQHLLDMLFSLITH